MIVFSTSSRGSFVVSTAPAKRTMIGATLLLLFASLQMLSVTGEDYIINEERPNWAKVKNGDFSLVEIADESMVQEYFDV